jgi:hypothetical protein
MKYVNFVINSEPNIHMLSSAEGGDDPNKLGQTFLRLYFNCEPVNIEFNAGEQNTNLRPEFDLFKRAITAYWTGSEQDILATWSEKSRAEIAEDINSLKQSGDWPRIRRSPFGRNARLIAILPTAEASIFYYSSESYMGEVAVTGDASHKNLALYNVADLSGGQANVFCDKLFAEAIKATFSQNSMGKK